MGYQFTTALPGVYSSITFFGYQNEISNSLINRTNELTVMTRSHISQTQIVVQFDEVSISSGNPQENFKPKEAENYEN